MVLMQVREIVYAGVLQNCQRVSVCVEFQYQLGYVYGLMVFGYFLTIEVG